ncbi:hypothetical protein FPV67DRAFT_1752194 [Lyophyllum atratum]|nr:hypothetical protein FPV67DRAFT_1752194 [Lyophyllum atratum]
MVHDGDVMIRKGVNVIQDKFLGAQDSGSGDHAGAPLATESRTTCDAGEVAAKCLLRWMLLVNHPGRSPLSIQRLKAPAPVKSNGVVMPGRGQRHETESVSTFEDDDLLEQGQGYRRRQGVVKYGAAVRCLVDRERHVKRHGSRAAYEHRGQSSMECISHGGRDRREGRLRQGQQGYFCKKEKAYTASIRNGEPGHSAMQDHRSDGLGECSASQETPRCRTIGTTGLASADHQNDGPGECRKRRKGQEIIAKDGWLRLVMVSICSGESRDTEVQDHRNDGPGECWRQYRCDAGEEESDEVDGGEEGGHEAPASSSRMSRRSVRGGAGHVVKGRVKDAIGSEEEDRVELHDVVEGGDEWRRVGTVQGMKGSHVEVNGYRRR